MEQLSGFAEVIPRTERPGVRFGHLRGFAKASLNPRKRVINRPGVQPRNKAEGEEVLRALRVSRLDASFLTDLGGDRGHRDLVDKEIRQRPIVARILGVAGLVEVPIFKGVGVQDDGGTALQHRHIGLQAGRVHGHQHIGAIAMGRDVMVRNVDLKRGNATEGAGRGTNLCGVVREGCQVVTEHRRDLREAVTGELHAVARVARKPDYYPVDLLRGQPASRHGACPPLGRRCPLAPGTNPSATPRVACGA